MLADTRVLWLVAILGLVLAGYLGDRGDRKGNKEVILGDCSWWWRRLWFWTRWFQDMAEMTMEGYEKFSKSDRLWATWMFDSLVYVLPAKYIDEVKGGSRSKLSTLHRVDEHLQWSLHTGNLLDDGSFVTSITKHLNPKLPQMTEYISDIVQEAINFRLGPGSNSRGWRHVNLSAAMMDISMRLTAVMWMGPKLGLSEEYRTHSDAYINTAVEWPAILFSAPSWSRKALFWACPSGRKIRYHLQKLKETLAPELLRRLHSEKSNEPFSLIDGLLPPAEDPQREAKVDQAIERIQFITFAAAPLIALITNQFLLTAMGYPDVADVLREEMRTAIAQNGGLNEKAVADMPKLDSFLRETLRLSPPQSLTMTRRVMQDFRLSNGFVLKEGVSIGVPTRGILRDPNNYDNPLTFDPLRFYDATENKPIVSSATMSQKYPVFGYGTYSCPGRYYGILVSKLCLAELLLNWEVKFMPERSGKPVDCAINAMTMPNVDTFIAFRKNRNYSRGFHERY